MNHKEEKKKIIEVLAKVSGLDTGKAKFHIRKCYPYSDNCYNEITETFYYEFWKQPGQVMEVISTCEEHSEYYLHSRDWHRL